MERLGRFTELTQKTVRKTSHLNSKKFLRRWWHSHPGCAAGRCVVCPDARENQQARSLLASVTQAGVSALACFLGFIGVGEQRFYFLFEQWIADTGAFHKGRSLKRIIAFDGIGQDRLYLLPAFRSHRSREGRINMLTSQKLARWFEVLRAFINLWICYGRNRVKPTGAQS